MDNVGMRQWGLTILRVVVGLVFTAHGCQKLFTFGIPSVVQMFGHMGIPAASVLAPFVTLLEFVGGILLVVGLLTRWVALLLAKFIPGLSTVAPPMAGLVGMPVLTFALADSAGSALWVTAFASAGWIFRRELVRVAEFALGMGSWLAVVLAGLLALYVLFKIWERQRFLRRLRIARISPEDLQRKLQAGEQVMIVDLRHPRDVESQGSKLPGALRMAPTELDARHQEIPRDRDIILYCS